MMHVIWFKYEHNSVPNRANKINMFLCFFFSVFPQPHIELDTARRPDPLPLSTMFLAVDDSGEEF